MVIHVDTIERAREVADELRTVRLIERLSGEVLTPWQRRVLGALFPGAGTPRTPAPCFSLPLARAERFSRDGHGA